MAAQPWIGWAGENGTGAVAGLRLDRHLGPPQTRLCRAVKGCGACGDGTLSRYSRCTRLPLHELASLSEHELTFLHGLPVCPLDAEDELQHRAQVESLTRAPLPIRRPRLLERLRPRRSPTT